MFVDKKIRIAIYKALFEDGVLTAKKNIHPKSIHSQCKVPNLFVIKMLQSLKSKGFVVEKFCWQYFYWTLTNEGIEYLREYLKLPSESIPLTLQTRTIPSLPASLRGRPMDGARGGYGARRDRDDYRPRQTFDSSKQMSSAPFDFAPRYDDSGRGGRGRGGYRGGMGGGGFSSQNV